MKFEIAGRSDLGRVRLGNEDAFVLVQKQSVHGATVLAAVADGVGGAPNGELASAVAVDVLQELLGRQPSSDALREAFVRADREVQRLPLSQLDSRHPATTLLAALLADSAVWIANTGDSRAYLWRDEQIQRLTKDHSVVQERIDAGLLSIQDARRDPDRNLITRMIGGGSNSEPDVSQHDLVANDIFLLCTDGLWDVVDDDDIGWIIGRSHSVDQAVDALVSLAISSGGPDNITVLIVKVLPNSSNV